MNLQQQVKQHLDNTGISLRELSRRSGVSHTTIGKILKGGTYKSDTANDLIFAMSFYGGDTARPVMQDKAAETLHDKVEQLAADRVDCDVMTRDDALECSKQRRIEALEAEVQVWRKKEHQACEQAREMAHNLQDVLEKREQHLKSCENALIEAHTERDLLKSEHEKAVRELNSEQHNIFALKQAIERKDAWIENQDAARNQLQLSLRESLDKRDVLQSRFDSLQDAYNQQVDDEAEMLAQIDTLFAERDNTATLHDQQIMRLRVYIWILVAALVFVVASGLVVWGGI